MLNELDEEEEQLVAMVVVLASSKNRIQTNAINAEKDSFGEFNHMFPQLLLQENRFLMHFRMTKEEFYSLLHILIPSIIKYTQLRKCIPTEERLGVCLRKVKLNHNYVNFNLILRK